MSRFRASVGFDWTMTVLSAILLGGLFLDGWAHTHGRVDNTFFTPWHAVLYAGWATCLLVLAGTLVRNVAEGHAWRQALPAGYGLSLVGAALWLVGGPSDLIWHELFGFEADVEALLSPAHFILALGVGLIVSGPLRSAWGQPDTELEGWWRRLPMLLSLTLVLSQVTFFTQIGHPIANLWGGGSARPALFANDAQEFGIVSILLWTMFLMGAVLLLLHRGGAPIGSFTLMLTLNGGAMGVLYDQGPYPLAQVGAFVAGGVAADALRALLRPDAARHQAWRIFAFAMPAALHLAYFLSLMATHGIWWSLHLWLGTVVFSGVTGWLLSYLIVPTRGREMAHETV